MMPQLLYPLREPATSVALQLASARALRSVIAECAPRMARWTGDVLDGVCRCWVSLAAPGPHGTRKSYAFPSAGVCTRGISMLTSLADLQEADEADGRDRDAETSALRDTLRGVCSDLKQACPDAAQVCILNADKTPQLSDVPLRSDL